MSGILTKLSYKQLHILKHALAKYIEREGIAEQDLLSERHLLRKINERIDDMKERHRIQGR